MVEVETVDFIDDYTNDKKWGEHSESPIKEEERRNSHIIEGGDFNEALDLFLRDTN